MNRLEYAITKMIGKTFNRLYVLKYVGKTNGLLKYECLCTCGNTKIMSANDLRRGNILSCGCFKKELNRKKISSIEGKIFGRLTVISFHERKNKITYYTCKCSCGKEVITSKNGLISGTTKSCGCLRKEITSKIHSKELVGQRFGRLAVVEYVETRNRRRRYKCLCDCGVTKLVDSGHLLDGTIRSCGCLRKEMATKHGDYSSVEYKIWSDMKRRCYNKNVKMYKHYGGREITVCDRWLNSYENFISDMGRRPSKKHSIDRINNDGNYEPSNCRWATSKEQALNKRPEYIEASLKILEMGRKKRWSKNN